MVMPRMTLETDEWWVRVAKLDPTQLGAEGDDTHSIVIQKKDDVADRSEYERCFERLFPLLKFIFGSSLALSIGVGYATGGGASLGAGVQLETACRHWEQLVFATRVVSTRIRYGSIVGWISQSCSTRLEQ